MVISREAGAAAPKGSMTYAFSYGEFSSPSVRTSVRPSPPSPDVRVRGHDLGLQGRILGFKAKIGGSGAKIGVSGARIGVSGAKILGSWD